MPCSPVSWTCIGLFLVGIKKTEKEPTDTPPPGWPGVAHWDRLEKYLHDSGHTALCYSLQPEPHQAVGSLNKNGVIPNGI